MSYYSNEKITFCNPTTCVLWNDQNSHLFNCLPSPLPPSNKNLTTMIDLRGNEGLYSVKANYDFLWAHPTSLSPILCGAIHKLWESWAPSKVVVFSWQTLLLRIPTRTNLATRGVVFEGDHLLCRVCGGGVETKIIYSSCYLWLGLFGLRCIGGSMWWRCFLDPFIPFLLVFCPPWNAVRSSLKGSWWFGMRIFGSFGGLRMIKFSPTNPLSLRRFSKELSVFLGSGWRGNQILFVCTMSGVSTL
jgi:hypothetical protein